MPAIKAKVEGRGNGIKTVVDNCVDVARALQRPSEYVCKHFGFELGAQCQMNAKTERYIVNGSHEASTLQDKLDIFIRNWVLCPSCDNPETSLKCKDGAIQCTCKACGYRGDLKVVGRMAQYILKNSPEKFTVGEKAMYKKESAARNTSDDKDSAKQKPKNSPKHAGWDDSDSFALSTDDNARIDRALKDLNSQMQGLTIGIDDLVEKLEVDKKYEFFVKHAKRIKKDMGDDFAENGASDIACLRDNLQLTDGQGLWCYCSAFQKWTEKEDKEGKEKKISEKKFMEYLSKFKTHLKALCEGCDKSQKMMLGVVETVVYNNKKKCLPYTAHILKQLYDDDILEDTSIVKWAEKPSKKFVKKNFVEKMVEQCTQLVEWLKEDDSEDESSSEEDDSEATDSEDEKDVKPTSSDKPTPEESSSKQDEEQSEEKTGEVSEKAPEPQNHGQAVTLDDSDDEEIDIDDI